MVGISIGRLIVPSLSASACGMAIVSRLFSLIVLSAVLFDLLSITMCIDPAFFVGPSEAGQIGGESLSLSFQHSGPRTDVPAYCYLFLLIDVIPFLALFWSLQQATMFLKTVAQNRPFDSGGPKYVRHVAIAGGVYLITTPLTIPVINAIARVVLREKITFSKTPLMINLNFGSIHTTVSWIGLFILVLVGLLIVIASIMRRASLMAADHSQIV